MKVVQKAGLAIVGGVAGGLATYGLGWLVGDYWAGLAVLVPLFYLLGRAEGRASVRKDRAPVGGNSFVRDDDFWDVDAIPKRRKG